MMAVVRMWRRRKMVAVTVVTTSYHSEATAVIVLRYTDLRQGKGKTTVIIYMCFTQMSSFTCAGHKG